MTFGREGSPHKGGNLGLWDRYTVAWPVQLSEWRLADVRLVRDEVETEVRRRGLKAEYRK